MGITTDSIAAVQNATEAADYDVVEPDGRRHVEHGLHAASAALSAGALYAIEQEAQNWYAAVAAEYRPEAEAAKVVDLNAAIQATLDQHRTLTLASDS